MAAFLNSREGGTLLIGVADAGSVFGLGSDYATLRKPGKDGRDLFGLHLNQALSNAVGMAATANVSQQILEVGGKDVCRVHVKPSGFPIEAEVVEVENGQYVKKKLFYGRFGNATRPINRPVASPKVIHPSSWKGCSANFALRVSSEVRAQGGLRKSTE